MDNIGCVARGHYTLECFEADGRLKWRAESDNLVVNIGLKDMCDKYFTGAAYTAGWFLGLYGPAATNNPASGDTMLAHPGWTEATFYSDATRRPVVFTPATTASPAIISNAASPAIFVINATGVIGGLFLTSDSTKGGTAGTLFSAADLQAPGDRSVVNGNSVNATYRFELTAGP